MRKAIKLGLLTAAASVILALPMAASAETSSRGEPFPTIPRTEAIYQVPQVITQVPLEMKGYLGTVVLHPSIGVSDTFETTLPVFWQNRVNSLTSSGESSDVYAKITKTGTAIKFYTSLNVVSKSTIIFKVANHSGAYGYYIINVIPKV